MPGQHISIRQICVGNRRPGGRGAEQVANRKNQEGKEPDESPNDSADTLNRLMSKGREESGTCYDVNLFKDVPLGGTPGAR